MESYNLYQYFDTTFGAFRQLRSGNAMQGNKFTANKQLHEQIISAIYLFFKCLALPQGNFFDLGASRAESLKSGTDKNPEPENSLVNAVPIG